MKKNREEIYKLLVFLGGSYPAKGFNARADKMQMEKLSIVFADCDRFMFSDAINWCSKHLDSFPTEKQLREAYALKAKGMGDTLKEKQEAIEFSNNSVSNKKAETACLKKFGESFLEDYVKQWVKIFYPASDLTFCFRSPAILDLYECNFDLEKVFNYSKEKNDRIVKGKKDSVQAIINRVTNERDGANQ